MATVSIERIKQLLGSGLNQEIVATAVGCDPSYVSQLLADEQFAAEVSNLRSAALMQDSRRDTTIGGIEDKLLKKLEDCIDEGAFYKPNDVLRAAAVVNRMQRRGAGAPQHSFTRNVVVPLQLPTRVVRKFTITQDGEVVGVDNQTLVTMTSAQLLKSLSGRLTAQRGDAVDVQNKYDKAARFLPAVEESSK